MPEKAIHAPTESGRVSTQQSDDARLEGRPVEAGTAPSLVQSSRNSAEPVRRQALIQRAPRQTLAEKLKARSRMLYTYH